jgi:CheY-like chemotaxis protein
VYGFVRQCGGTAEVESDLGSGTTLTLFLPISAGVIAAESPAATAESEPGRGETVFVVEDEPFLRELLRAILEEQGYAVLSAESGADALRVAAAHDGSIDVVLTDLLMPGMTGRRSWRGSPRRTRRRARCSCRATRPTSELVAAIRRALLSSTAG